MVRAPVVHEGRELTVEMEIAPGRANRARINRAPVARPRDVLGILRTVLFAPEDLALVRGDPAERRRFLDELLVARRPRFAAVRADYDRVLQQRSALLKTARNGGRSSAGADLRTLDVWDGHLARHGAALLAGRLELVAGLAAPAVEAFAEVAPSSEPIALVYRSSLEGDLPADADDAGADCCSTRCCGCAARRWSAACAWSARTATTWSCGSARGPRRATRATASRGRSRWRCGWRPTGCCARTASSRC